MMPVGARLETLIAQVREVGAGVTVGYNGRWTAPRPVSARDAVARLCRRLSALPGSGRGHALVDGIPCPIVGLISMDLIILDVSAVPSARRGTMATLIGDTLDVDTVGRAADTIGYEILTEFRFPLCSQPIVAA